MVSISYQFLVGQSTVSAVILDTCQVLWDVLSQEVFRPLSEELWMDVARGFWEQWDFPNCIGALDGRHCVVQVRATNHSQQFCPPPLSGRSTVVAKCQLNFNIFFPSVVR